jgi:Protein of unknown function (DUF4435)
MSDVAASTEPEVEAMRARRNSPAVLKTRLASFRSTFPHGAILAFEGDDDKRIYFHWINKIRYQLRYEPFPCSGKDNVLKLRAILERDLGNLRESVYFFIDRDFDDRRGEAPSDNLFMTDQYSIENYLVTHEVVDALLRDDLHCHTLIELRKQVVALFDNVYTQFLTQTRDLNFEIFIARRTGIDLAIPIKTKVSKLAAVELTAVSPSEWEGEKIATLSAEVSEEIRNSLRQEFDTLNPMARYRGKFALAFFSRWLELLTADRNSENSQLFRSIDNGSKGRAIIPTLDSIASKSSPPEGLTEFVMAMTE